MNKVFKNFKHDIHKCTCVCRPLLFNVLYCKFRLKVHYMIVLDFCKTGCNVLVLERSTPFFYIFLNSKLHIASILNHCRKTIFCYICYSYCRELGSIQERGSHLFSALLTIPSSNISDERSPRPNYPKGRNLPTGDYSTTTRPSRNGACFSQVQIMQW